MAEGYSDNEAIIRVSRRSLFQTGTSIPLMRSLKPCQATACPVFERCVHDKYGKCGFEAEYLETVLESFLEVFKANPNKRRMLTFGLQIVPLYLDLCRLSMLESSLKKPDYMDLKGNVRVHPVYQEKRNTINMINQTLRTSGLQRFFEKFDVIDLPVAKVEIDEEDENFHASLET